MNNQVVPTGASFLLIGAVLSATTTGTTIPGPASVQMDQDADRDAIPAQQPKHVKVPGSHRCGRVHRAIVP